MNKKLFSSTLLALFSRISCVVGIGNFPPIQDIGTVVRSRLQTFCYMVQSTCHKESFQNAI